MRRPSLRDRLKPLELVAMAAGLAVFTGAVAFAGSREWQLALIFAGIAFIAALLVLAVFTAVSMTLVTTGFGAVLGAGGTRGAVAAAAPGLGLASLAFGVWYAAAAWSLAPYPF